MPENQLTKINHLSIALLIIITIFLPRVTDLDAFRAPDEDRWMARATGFTRELAHGRLTQLLKSPTPGVTTQWLGSLTIHSDSWAIRKLPLVISQALLVLITGYIFWRLWGWPPAVTLVALLALDPLLIAQTRIYGTDSLLSIFLLLSLGALLLWRENSDRFYLAISALAAAAAILSKIPGIIILPFTLGLFIWWRSSWSSVFIWLLFFIIGLSLILPSLALSPQTTIQNILETFRSTGYTQLHTGSWHFYLSTLFFFTTPLHLLAIAALPIVLTSKSNQTTRQHLLILLIFAAAFTLMMSLGAKKGDRYILPVFLLLDALSALVITRLITRRTIKAIAIILILWQTLIIYQLHPYYLAYVNPITKPFFGDKKLGWGEGLDLAADYLNQKPDAKHLKVAAFYPNEFSYNFTGEVVPIHQYDHESIDYVVAYRGMFDRDPNAWETDVLNQLKKRAPEKVIKINNLDYAWIYKKP